MRSNNWTWQICPNFLAGRDFPVGEKILFGRKNFPTKFCSVYARVKCKPRLSTVYRIAGRWWSVFLRVWD